MSDWYEADPPAGLKWAREYLVGDLREQAKRIRERAESEAWYLEAKADLLADMLDASLRETPP